MGTSLPDAGQCDTASAGQWTLLPSHALAQHLMPKLRCGPQATALGIGKRPMLWTVRSSALGAGAPSCRGLEVPSSAQAKGPHCPMADRAAASMYASASSWRMYRFASRSFTARETAET